MHGAARQVLFQQNDRQPGLMMYARHREGSILFAVSTPGGEELHHPDIITVQHGTVKVIIGQLHHILFIASTTSTLITTEPKESIKINVIIKSNVTI